MPNVIPSAITVNGVPGPSQNNQHADAIRANIAFLNMIANKYGIHTSLDKTTFTAI